MTWLEFAGVREQKKPKCYGKGWKMLPPKGPGWAICDLCPFEIMCSNQFIEKVRIAKERKLLKEATEARS